MKAKVRTDLFVQDIRVPTECGIFLCTPKLYDVVDDERIENDEFNLRITDGKREFKVMSIDFEFYEIP